MLGRITNELVPDENFSYNYDLGICDNGDYLCCWKGERRKVNENDWIFGKLPNWLRWILALPVAVLLSLILPLLGWISAKYVTGMPLDNLFAKILTIVISVGGFLFGLFYCVPKFKSVIASVASILLSIFCNLHSFWIRQLDLGNDHCKRNLRNRVYLSCCPFLT